MKNTKCRQCEGKDLQYSVLIEEFDKLEKLLGEREITIHFLVKAASVIEAERNQFERYHGDDVPF